MISALISAVSAAGGLIVDKVTLSRRSVPLKIFIPVVFTFLFAFTLIFTPLYGYIDWSTALLPNNLFLMLLMIVIAIAWNVLAYQSLQRESVHQHEVILMTGPIVTILLAALFFQEEFNLTIFVLGLIASFAMLIARTEKHHFKFDKIAYNLFLAVILMSIENVIIRELLYSYSPISLYAFRTFFLALFFWFYYRPKLSEIGKSPLWLLGLSGAIGALSMVTRFYAFGSLGVIFTTLISTLAPIVVFIGSWEILHERIRPRVIVASLVILVCVAVATVLTNQL
ncbi:MAG: DMT family transporter [Candidatus Berkelbacteria bacterium]|nr:DMT family transporter [Candidatus Berkelbacteria bacterium]